MRENGYREVVAVTSASRRVGWAVAHAFAKWSAHVGVVTSWKESLEGAQREVESLLVGTPASGRPT
jgi:NAD(P)-dependent dehydrogenase (short-subunit alcohol dehydrogenase family)